MSFKSTPLQAPPTPGAFARYPLVLHRGEHPNIQSRRAHSAEDEAEALAAGWSHARPHVPDPEPEKPMLTLEDRVAALEANLIGLLAFLEEHPISSPESPKRGRPKKELLDAS